MLFIPAHDEDDPKYAVIGRELLQSGTGVFTEHGLLFPDRSRPFEEPYQEVYIDPADAFACIKNALGFREVRDTFVCVKNGELMRGEDVSHHGSPLYEYQLISNNPKWIS